MQLIIWTLVLSVAMVAFPQEATFEQDLATVEQYYIPALFMSGHGPKETAPRAFQQFYQQWQQFTQNHRQALSKDPWASAVQRINAHLGKAAALFKENKIFEAHRELEPIRNILAEVRHQLGTPTVMDALTEFHDHMEVIMKTVRRKTADQLTPEDIQKIKTHADAAIKAWQQVQVGAKEKALYQLTDEQVAFIHRNIQAQHQTLAGLSQALEANNPAEILKYARGIRSGFITVFRALGKEVQ